MSKCTEEKLEEKFVKITYANGFVGSVLIVIGQANPSIESYGATTVSGQVGGLTLQKDSNFAAGISFAGKAAVINLNSTSSNITLTGAVTTSTTDSGVVFAGCSVTQWKYDKDTRSLMPVSTDTPAEVTDSQLGESQLESDDPQIKIENGEVYFSVVINDGSIGVTGTGKIYSDDSVDGYTTENTLLIGDAGDQNTEAV